MQVQKNITHRQKDTNITITTNKCWAHKITLLSNKKTLLSLPHLVACNWCSTTSIKLNSSRLTRKRIATKIKCTISIRRPMRMLTSTQAIREAKAKLRVIKQPTESRLRAKVARAFSRSVPKRSPRHWRATPVWGRTRLSPVAHLTSIVAQLLKKSIPVRAIINVF